MKTHWAPCPEPADSARPEVSSRGCSQGPEGLLPFMPGKASIASLPMVRKKPYLYSARGEHPTWQKPAASGCELFREEAWMPRGWAVVGVVWGRGWCSRVGGRERTSANIL